MKLLESINVPSNDGPKTIELYQGDLTTMRPWEAVDIMVISAFPNRYNTGPRTLIGAINSKGLSVDELARNPHEDLRMDFSCWISKPIGPRIRLRGVQCKRILCFEPGFRTTLDIQESVGAPVYERVNPLDTVGDIFRSISPFLGAKDGYTTIAMPLVSTHRRGVTAPQMLDAIVEAAVQWMALGLPLNKLKIVEPSVKNSVHLKSQFSTLKRRFSNHVLPTSETQEWDLFISYSHKDADRAFEFVRELKHQKPNLRVFVDRLELQPGVAWQYEIYEALDKSKKVVSFLSPSYLSSKVCIEEFNIALFRQREVGKNVLVPIYIDTAQLPTYMKLLQFIDCRVDIRDLFGEASKSILNDLATE